MPLCPSICSSVCSTNYSTVSYPHAGELAVKKQVVFSDNVEGKQILAKVEISLPTFVSDLTPGYSATFQRRKMYIPESQNLFKKTNFLSSWSTNEEPVRDETKVEMFSIHSAPRIQPSEYLNVFSMCILTSFPLLYPVPSLCLLSLIKQPC